jgi:hypothetical protein
MEAIFIVIEEFLNWRHVCVWHYEHKRDMSKIINGLTLLSRTNFENFNRMQKMIMWASRELSSIYLTEMFYVIYLLHMHVKFEIGFKVSYFKEILN